MVTYSFRSSGIVARQLCKTQTRYSVKANFDNNSQDSIEIGREVGFSKIMAWDARRNGKENGIRRKNDARLS